MESKETINKEKKKPLWLEYSQALGIALVIAFVVRSFVFQAFKIPSESMVSTLLVGDYLIGTKFDYAVKVPFTDKVICKTGDPERGDIIIFKYPRDPRIDFIKRIVGVPGDTIEVRNKQLYRNGEAVHEDYIQNTDSSVIPVRDNFGPVKVPADHYFVMGDNRDNSMDSRYWGFVCRDAIQARAWRIYFSWAGIKDIRWSRIGRDLHRK